MLPEIIRGGIKKMCPNIEIADKFGAIVVGNNVHIGVDAIIMPGVTIGNNVIIGAGAIVTKDIPDNSVAVGIPAKPIETIEEYIEKNKETFVYTKNLSYEEKKWILLASGDGRHSVSGEKRQSWS